jgi:hypothetical protein
MLGVHRRADRIVGAALDFEDKRIAFPPRQKVARGTIHKLRMWLAVDRAADHTGTIVVELNDAQIGLVLVDDHEPRVYPVQQLPDSAEIGFAFRARRDRGEAHENKPRRRSL